jgi:methylated-DNA-protein-cysteine methyltransferase-like protein
MTDRHNFFAEVYEVVRQIPEGRVSTYGAIANFLGLKSGARMVGWALNQSFALDDVPAHRVVNRKGELSGRHHFPAHKPMEVSLQAEGIEIEDFAVKEFRQRFWDPHHELLG